MAVILIEEVLCGMDEAKGLLEQALLTLAEVVEEMAPAVGRPVSRRLCPNPSGPPGGLSGRVRDTDG